MYKHLQKNSKKLMAFFAVFLMIAFLIPTFSNRGGTNNPVEGTILGKTKIHASERYQATKEWDLLRRYVYVRQLIPASYASQSRYDWAPIVFQLGQMAYQQIENHPEMYLLLQKEAQNMGIRVSPEQVDAMLKEQVMTPGLKMDDPDVADSVRQALSNFLLVKGAYDRSASAIKISDPYRRQEIANRWQEIKLNLVEFDAKDFAKKVPAPTTDQSYDQFIKYGNVSPDKQDPQGNPFGFGYRYPDRVKLQYISIPREEVRKVIEKSRSPERWKVEAWKYYLSHQSEFPTTAQSDPFGDAAMTLGPTVKAAKAAKSNVTTRPFEDVQADVMKSIAEPEIRRLEDAIQSKIGSVMAFDWITYQKAAAASTNPANIPLSSLGVPFNSYEYLQKLAASIQKQFGVLPTVTQFADLLTAKDLAVVSKIGKATSVAQPYIPFAAYATLRDHPEALKLFQPSKPLRDAENNAYIFRLTAYDAAHMPADKTEVMTKVNQDLRTEAAYNMARDAAEDFLAAAKKTSLTTAAKNAKRNVISTGWFYNMPGGDVPNFILSEKAAPVFVNDAFKLLKDAAKGKTTQPIGIIDAQRDAKVVVAQLQSVKPVWDGETPMQANMQITAGLTEQFEQYFQMDWFNYNNVASRLQYLATTPQRQNPSTPSAPQAPAPTPLGM